MKEKVPGRHVPNSPLRRLYTAGVALLLAMVLSGSAWAQTAQVTGTVTGASGGPLQGVTVRVQGAETRAVTRGDGRYTIAAPPTGTLSFTIIGQRPVTQAIGGRSTVDVRMEPVAFLEEVIVTAYAEQRRADITGAVASINVEAAQRQTSASVLQKLDVVPGITVAASGSPGARSTVRIRGISSFQNNDPLYIIDGTPVQDSYINFLNPNDITSIQVLKDASASSIYGSRASNGVIVIETTKRGVTGPPRMTLSARTGIATPTRGYDDFLITDALQYHEIIKRSYENAGQSAQIPTNIYGDPNNPTIPAYIFAAPGTSSFDAFGRPINVDVSKYSYPTSLIMPGSAGTNWWKAVFGTAPMADYNLSVAGSGEEHAFGVSANYFDQEGTAIHNRYRRGSVRANTSFSRGRFTFGENAALGIDRAMGGTPDDPGAFAEGGILGKNILIQPVVPVRDVAGNFAGAKAPSTGSSVSNPVAAAYERRDDVRANNRAFGNVFAGFAPTPKIALRSTLGFNLSQGSNNEYTPPRPEDAEPSFTNDIFDWQENSSDWTWSNTARYATQMSQHNVSVLLGHEANQNRYRRVEARLAGLRNSDIGNRYVNAALGNADTRRGESRGSRSTLLSFFGKADYNYADKYVVSATLRQDGSSRLGPENRWGTFPAFGLGWRISKEPFLANNSIVSDAMIRIGYGVTGNQNIPSGRITDQFGGRQDDVFYDITGSNSTLTPGFRATSIGNADLKWEENRSTNLGADLQLFNGAVSLIVDVYQRNTNNLLFDPLLPATAGVADAPIVNIGKMRNTGFDLSLGHQGARWNATLTASKYKNEIVSINGVQNSFQGATPTSRLDGNPVINKVGYPIGSFWGRIADGYFKDAAEAAASGQSNAAAGRIKFRDLNGDKTINTDDNTIIGNPHPDFTSSLDLGYRMGNFDVNGTVFGSFGNDIFDAQKNFYVFQNFNTTVQKEMLTDSWTPQNLDAKYPILDRNDTFSRSTSSYYVEDGSYVRLRNLQIGWNVPQSLVRWTNSSRIYLQGENLFTITGYDGLDPSLPAANVTTPSGQDVRDQYRGLDRGTYPSSRIFSIGFSTSF